MNKQIICTKHAIKRLKERVGVNKKQAPKFVNKIRMKGIHFRELDGKIRRFADKVRLKQEGNVYLFLYGNAFYIFRGRMFVTVLIVPDIIYNGYKDKIKELEVINEKKMDATSSTTL